MFNADHAQVAVLVGLDDARNAFNFRNNRFALGGLASFKEFFNAGQTGRDVTAAAGSHTTGVEGTQGQLCTRLADGLGGHDTNSRAHFHGGAAAEVNAVAHRADAVGQFAGHG